MRENRHSPVAIQNACSPLNPSILDAPDRREVNDALEWIMIHAVGDGRCGDGVQSGIVGLNPYRTKLFCRRITRRSRHGMPNGVGCVDQPNGCILHTCPSGAVVIIDGDDGRGNHVLDSIQPLQPLFSPS